MSYDKHIFISYAHLDNQPLTPEQEGWVSRFHESLQTILTMRLGQKARIWRDKKLSGNDSFADEIISQFPSTEILISVLSKCYVRSEWCKREVQEFCRRCGDLRVGNKYRIMKVIKLPLDNVDLLPPPMNEMLGYEFFTYQDREQAKTPLELDPLYFPKLAPLYIEKLCILADDVIDVISRMEAPDAHTAKGVHQSPPGPRVYLAECSRDQKEAREAIEMDLRQHGYSILPDRQLPHEESEFVAEVSRQVEQSSLAVHIIGGYSGFVPDGPSQKSIVVLQNELAIAESRKRTLPRIIWLPAGTEAQASDQRHFIEALHRDAEAQFGADLITGDLEVLKAAVHAALRRIENAGAEADVEHPPDSKLLYLICDQRDREAALPVRKLLKSKGFDVKIPLFDGSASTLDDAKRDMLSKCAAAVIFYGKGDEGWKRAVDTDLLKSKAYRRDKLPLPQLTYLSAPATAEKIEMIELEEPNLVNGLDGFSDSSAKALVGILQAV